MSHGNEMGHSHIEKQVKHKWQTIPQTFIIHFTGATDYSADVFPTGPAAISRTKENYEI